MPDAPGGGAVEDTAHPSSEPDLPPEPGDLSALEGRTFEAVLFDMDGTLIDSTPVVERSWLRWAEEEGVDPAQLAGMHGVPAAGIIARLLPAERGLAAHERIEAIELADTEGIVLLPGAAEALRGVPPERVAIATSCTRSLAEARIEVTRLAAPATVVTAEDTERGKPHPDPYLLAAQRLGADPARCLVVEDAPAGLRAAIAAGCATLAVASTHEVAELAEVAPDALVASLDDVTFTGSRDGVRVAPRG